MATITLKTLPDATEQQVFDHVARHLLTQKVRSSELMMSNISGKRDEVCVYRDPDGKMCAAGCLMADDEYDPTLERHSWGALVDAGRVPPNHENLIFSLQRVHDQADPDTWKRRLRQVAFEYDLSNAVLEEFT